MLKNFLLIEFVLIFMLGLFFTYSSIWFDDKMQKQS